jgi:hypothetical protein
MPIDPHTSLVLNWTAGGLPEPALILLLQVFHHGYGIIRVKIRLVSQPLVMSESRRQPAIPGRGSATTGDSAACGPVQT